MHDYASNNIYRKEEEMVDRLIHLNECAALMGVSRSKAYRLAKTHEAPFENVQRYGSTYMVPYLAFCERLGIRPETQAGMHAEDGDVLCMQ